MLTLRPALRTDASLIVTLIRELAAYEQLADACFVTDEAIARTLFGESPKAHAVVAEWKGEPAGFALYFYNYSTFLARPGIYIEDVFVRPEFRRKGIARGLFQHLAQKAVQEECGRLEWSVLDWNADAIALYRALGAVAVDGWTVQRVTGEALKTLATE